MYLGIWHKRVFGSLSLCSVVGWVGCVKTLVSMALLRPIYLNLLLLEDQISPEERFFFLLVLNRTICMVCIDCLYYHSQRNFTDYFYWWRRVTFSPFAHYNLPVSGYVCSLRGKNSHWKIWAGETSFLHKILLTFSLTADSLIHGQMKRHSNLPHPSRDSLVNVNIPGLVTINIFCDCV